MLLSQNLIFLQISVKYGGLDIPGSPFQLTANPNQEGAEDDGFYRNGTGLQRKKQSG